MTNTDNIQQYQWRSRWTKEQEARLVSLVDMGHSRSEIAMTMCISRGAVCGKYHRLCNGVKRIVFDRVLLPPRGWQVA